MVAVWGGVWWWDELCQCSAPRLPPAWGSQHSMVGEAAWDSLSPQQGWAGSQARRLHLLPQKSPPVQPPQPAKGNVKPSLRAGSVCLIKSHAPWEEPPIS